jgi:hypothetical protein
LAGSASGEQPAERASGANEPANVDTDSTPHLHSSDIANAEWRAGQLEAASSQLIAFANQRVIERRFRVLRRSVQLGGIAVLIGVGAFALAPKFAQPSPLAVAKPTQVTIFVKLPSKFGPTCTAAQLNGIAIGGDWDEPVVVTDASKGCRVTKLDLLSKIGIAIPVITSSSSLQKL